MRNKSVFLSVIIPVYNETLRINKLYTIVNFLKRQKYSNELILVDDGSNNYSKKMLHKFAKNLKFKIVTYKQNKGKGFAIKTGMLTSLGTYRLFTDIDLSVPIEEINKFIGKRDKRVIIGSRRIKGSKVITRQPFIRELMGRFFTGLSCRILGIKVTDFTCGFKCFHKDEAIEIFSKSRINRWGFDPEILFIATKLKYRIFEVPVTWRHDPNTKVRFPRDIFLSFYELLKIRLNDFLKFYE